jgi:hypothetical protein
MFCGDKFKPYILDFPQIPYPPYHFGKYLEEYFIEFYFKNKKDFDLTGYELIPISWTNIYNNHTHLLKNLQKDLNGLDFSKKYFTVSQHDDAPKESLPPNTIKFSAGGNRPNCVPIPLICSSIPNVKEVHKDIFCSFVGSATHPVRMDMLHHLVNKEGYVLKPKHWSPSIEDKRKDLFLDITSRSIFSLCPRGYGATSFRLYEAMQLGAIPVYIYTNEPYIPFSNIVNWNDICILVEKQDIKNIDNILKNISKEKQNEMRLVIKETYNKMFTLDGMCLNILNYLKTI